MNDVTPPRMPYAGPPDYEAPEIPRGLRIVEAPLVVATPETLRGYGELVGDRAKQRIEIVRWPAQGWRPVDTDCGDEAGTTEGIFECWWDGDVFRGTNGAVGGEYVLGFAKRPDDPPRASQATSDRLLLWHANYHPDGGQMFFPKRVEPYVVPMALPGDDVRPEHFVTFWFDGSQGCYMHPNVWHEGVFTCGARGRFHDRQGAVHARVSVEFPREFGCLLSVPLRRG
jgi:hypothetical protein